MLVAALPPTFTPSCPVEVAIGESPDDWCIHDATVTSCVFSRRTQTTPLLEQQEVLFPSNFVFLVSLSQGWRVQASGSSEEEVVLSDRRWGKHKWQGPLQLPDPEPDKETALTLSDAEIK